jgi:hypothetical protein
MRIITTLSLIFIAAIGYTQSLPIDFETGITTSNFVDFDGGVGTVITNPQSNGINTSATVGQIVRNGGEIWGGSKISLAANLDFTTNNVISMKVFTTAPAGTVVKFKLEGGGAAAEKDASTTTSGAWETLTWDFTGTPANFNDVVFMFDFGNVGDGSTTSTFLFDDVEQLFGGTQIDLPVDFEGSTINYTVTDFGGNASSLEVDPTDATNMLIKSIKTNTAETWAGTTVGTAGGFATAIPLTVTDSKMNVRVWSPDAGITVRLKVENSNDPTQSCETDATATVMGWNNLEFDFTNEAAGTAPLTTYAYNMASIFFNFGVDGATAGEKTYYFDDVKFGPATSSVKNQSEIEGLDVFPNPATNHWTISSENEEITSIELFDLQGKQLRFIEPNTHNLTINASEFATGMYILKVTTATGTSTRKLIKE